MNKKYIVGENVVVTAFSISKKGMGLCKEEDYLFFVSDLFINETALVKITEIKSTYIKATIIEYLKKDSKQRNAEEMLIYDAYPLANMKKDIQNKLQLTITEEAFQKYNLYKETDINILSNEMLLYYRNKATFFHDNSYGNILKLGIYQVNKQIKKNDEFILADGIINEVLQQINKANVLINPKDFKNITIRSNGISALVTITTKGLTQAKFITSIIDLLNKNSKIKGILHNKCKDASRNLSDYSKILKGVNELEFYYPNCGVKLYVDDCSFLQVNTPIADLTYKLIAEYIPRNANVFDCFCGVGGIGISIYKNIKISSLVFIDISKNNIKNLRKNLLLNNVANATVFEGDFFEYKFNLEDHNNDNTLIVDPPRSGLNEQVINEFKKLRFKKIIYLSCELETLMRDLSFLKDTYNVAIAKSIKMFYNTLAIETLVVLELKGV